jgi:Domain of Unknown Function (DUF1080)
MFKTIVCFLISSLSMVAFGQASGTQQNAQEKIILFNGKNLDGWEGHKNIWRVYRGAIVGGNKKEQIPKNEFLCTDSSYKNFELELKFKVRGYQGFINAGVQFHSQRLTNPSNEMAGYQADIGEGCMGSLYDESRRDKYLVQADQKKVSIKKGWNQYKIRCKDNTITLSINNIQTISYTEPDPSISLSGKIGLQIHGGGILEVFYKDIVLTPMD